MVSEKEKAQIVYELRRKFKIAELTKIADLSRSTYYYHIKNKDKPDKYEAIKELIVSIYNEHKGRYGYRRITLELHSKGYHINHKTVHNLMKQLNISCKIRSKKYHSFRGDIGKAAPNIIQRNFEASRPNQKWVTDVTEFALLGQKIYLSPIMDLYNREIISYSLGTNQAFPLIEEMLKMAFLKITDDSSILLHSDQGWQYQMKKYQRMLQSKGIIQSMSRKGNCLDNSVIENFFGLLKSEMFYSHKFSSVEQFLNELHLYIKYYNTQRIKVKLNGMSPVNYRIHSTLLA